MSAASSEMLVCGRTLTEPHSHRSVGWVWPTALMHLIVVLFVEDLAPTDSPPRVGALELGPSRMWSAMRSRRIRSLSRVDTWCRASLKL